MKNIFKLIRKIVISVCLLYAFNIITSKIGFYIPINIYTILLVTVVDFPGMILLIVLKFLL